LAIGYRLLAIGDCLSAIPYSRHVEPSVIAD
jgi:hypothetical protein